MSTPKGAEGVGHRVDDGRRGTDRAAFANALVAAGPGSRGLRVAVLDHGHLGNGGHEVVDERARDGVAVDVVGEVLEQGAPDPLHGPAVDLALDHVGVDHGAAILADDVAKQRDRARLGVDLACAHVRGVGPDHGRFGAVSAARLEPGRHVGGQRPHIEVGDGRDLRQGEARGRRASYAGAATYELYVLRRRLELVGGDGDDALAKRRGGRGDRPRDHRPAAAPTRTETEGRDRGVALDGVHVVQVDAECVGGELHGGGLEAVPRGATGEVHVHLAARLDADRRTLSAIEAHAGRGRFDVAAGSDAEEAALAPRRGLFTPETLVVEPLERGFEDLAW